MTASSRRGMTLMELVVGLTVTGLALSGGYAALAAATDLRMRAAAVVEHAARGAAERRIVAGWIGSARLAPDAAGFPFTGLDGVDDGYADDELSFAMVTDTVVRLFVDRDSTTPERGLVAELRWGRGARMRRAEIDSSVVSLDLRYQTRVLGKAEWLPSWISSTVLPLAAEVSLAAGPGDTLPGLLRLPLVVPLGNQR